MDNLSQLALRSQTIFGGFHFLFFLISWPFVIGFLKDYHDKDRLTFNCVPKPSDFTRQRCYDNYTSAMSPLLTPLDFAGITYGALSFFWVFFMLTGATILRRIQRARSEQRKRCQSRKFMRGFVCHVFIQFAVLGVMMGLFCSYQTLHFPVEYTCSQTNTTLTSFNRVAVNITCNDLRYKEKAKLNIAIIVIMAISIACCVLTVIHLAVTRNAFLEQLLGDIFDHEDDNAAGINLVDDGLNERSADADNLQTSAVNAYSTAMKASIKRQTEFQPKLLDIPTCSSMKTDEIFTNLLIQHGRKPVEVEEDMERRQRLGHYGQVSCGIRVKHCQEIFIRATDSENNPKSILLTGKAGIGKTLFCQKLVRDWADDKLFQAPTNAQMPNFKFAYLFTFRQLNLLGDRTFTLQQILNCSSILDDQSNIDDSLLEYILNHSEEVLIILDGFDECSQQDYIAGDTHEKHPNCAQAKMPITTLCHKLMKGQILGKSTVVITSRPDESDKLGGIRFDRKVEITGFSEQEVKEYIEKYFRENETMKNTVLEHITKNEDLVSFAHVPVLCALMCSYCEYNLNKSNSTEDLPVSTCDLYFEVLNIFEVKHSTTKTSLFDETTLDKLSEFAAQLLVDKKFLFDDEEMKKFNLQEVEVENMKTSGLLHCGPPFRVSFSQTTKYFCFTHLTLHEYLAARWFVKRRDIPERKTVSTMVLQFMAGILSKKKDSELMEELLKECSFPDEGNGHLLKAKCLKEYQDKEFAKNHYRQYPVQDEEISFRDINDVDCIALSFLLDIISSLNEEETARNETLAELPFISVKSLRISVSFGLTLSGVKRICRSLQSNFCDVTDLTLAACDINDEFVEYICGLLSAKLTTLGLSHNQITDAGAASLSVALKQPSSQVTTLGLIGNLITDAGVAFLCDALKQPSSQVTTLHLSGNQITDAGVASLCVALKQPNSQVTTLGLGGNQITDAGVAFLCDALKQPSSQVTALELSDNQIADAGAASLCIALKQPNSQVTTLGLSGNQITDAGVAFLCDALKQPSSQVTTLDLSGNQIADAGVAFLCDALKQPSSHVTKLNLRGNQITDAGAASLSVALNQPSSQVTILLLSGNQITDTGVPV